MAEAGAEPSLLPQANEPPEVTDDVFLGGGVRVRQPVRGYRAGLDAVMLAACVPPEEQGSVLDCGAGVGTVGLCVASRCQRARIVMVERQPALAGLAESNITVNGFGDRASVVAADVLAFDGRADAGELRPESFAIVLANPPYHDTDAGTPSTADLKAASHAMPANQLDAWVRFMARMCAPGGRAIMIHKTEALPRILSAFENRFGCLTILPLHPREGSPAHRVIVAGKKASRAPMVLLNGLVLHGDSNAFTIEADAILRHGATLPI